MPLTIEIRDPRSTDKDYNPIPAIGNPWCGIQNPRLSHNGFLIPRAVSTETFPRECCSVSKVRYPKGGIAESFGRIQRENERMGRGDRESLTLTMPPPPPPPILTGY